MSGVPVVNGHPCPECSSDVAARVIHLEPPYGAIVACHVCRHEYLITF